MLRLLVILFFALVTAGSGYAQITIDSVDTTPRFKSYQIYLKKEVQEIKEIKYFKDCSPINGNISQGKKTIIMEDYVPGNKVYMQLIYTDGTEDEIIRSPCFIDPVIL
jgi:hypothetical protein